MHYFLPSENSYPINNHYQTPVNPKRTPMNYFPQAPQDPNYSYYNTYPMKQNPAMLQEDPYTFNPIPQSQYPSDFTAYNFNGVGQPTAYSPTVKNKGWNNNYNYSFQHQQTSLESLTEFPTYESFKEQFPDSRKISITDEYFAPEAMVPASKSKDYIPASQTDLPFDKKDCDVEEEEDDTNFGSEEGMERDGLNYQNPSMKGWCEEDEKLLRKLAVQYRMDWKKIAKKFDNKKYTPYFLKMRYRGVDEGPVPKRVRFSHEEDVMIAKYFDEYGVEWEKMVQHFNNRTSVMLKNRYYSYIKKNNKLDILLKQAGVRVKGNDLLDEKLDQVQREETDCGTAASENDLLNKSPSEGENKEMDGENGDEVAKLKAQAKSWKLLYFVTLKKLNQAMASGEDDS